MKRKIMFRAWDKKENKWLFGYDYGNLGGFSLTGEVVLTGQLSYLSLNKIFEDVEFMQYVGLLDKNDKEIYEGDILKCGYGIGQVIFNSGCFMVQWIDDVEAYMEFVFSRKGMYTREDGDRFEIIGNIYQNPELLNK